MSSTTGGPLRTTVPTDVLAAVLGGYAERIALHLVTASTVAGLRQTPHPGDMFGTVLLWAWRTDPDRAMLLLADLHNQLCFEPGPFEAYTLDEVLDGLRYTPVGASVAEHDQLVHCARTMVPALTGR